MIPNLWLRVLNVFKYIFTSDPIERYILSLTKEIHEQYRERITQYETTILYLKTDINDRNAVINELQERMIKILTPREELVITQNLESITSVPRSGWQSEQRRLEEINSRKNRESVLKVVAEREAEVEALLNETAL